MTSRPRIRIPSRPRLGCDRLVIRAKVVENQIMEASAIAISYDSLDESVGSSPSRVILFGDIPTVIPSTFVVALETSIIALVISSAAPVVETTLVTSPTILIKVTTRPSSSFEFPITPVTTPPGIRRQSAILIRPEEAIPFGRPYRTYLNGPHLYVRHASTSFHIRPPAHLSLDCIFEEFFATRLILVFDAQTSSSSGILTRDSVHQPRLCLPLRRTQSSTYEAFVHLLDQLAKRTVRSLVDLLPSSTPLWKSTLLIPVLDPYHLRLEVEWSWYWYEDDVIEIMMRIGPGMMAYHVLSKDMPIDLLGSDVVHMIIIPSLYHFKATHAANALETEDKSQNGSDGDNGNGNGRNENPDENGRGDRHVARECTYQDFMKCQPLNFKGTEGVVGFTIRCAPTWWNSHKRTIGTEAALPHSTMERCS
ncbi:hypothetical protein Tco_0145481 [Tanacetum coccineum]